VGCCECGDEPSGSGAMELVIISRKVDEWIIWIGCVEYVEGIRI
jgi:hypothetical protein